LAILHEVTGNTVTPAPSPVFNGKGKFCPSVEEPYTITDLLS